MRVTKQPPLQPFVGDADHDRGAASVTVSVRLSSGIDQLQVARADNAVQQQVEESVHGATPASVRPVVFPPLSPRPTSLLDRHNIPLRCDAQPHRGRTMLVGTGLETNAKSAFTRKDAIMLHRAMIT